MCVESIISHLKNLSPQTVIYRSFEKESKVVGPLSKTEKRPSLQDLDQIKLDLENGLPFCSRVNPGVRALAELKGGPLLAP